MTTPFTRVSSPVGELLLAADEDGR